MSAHGTSGQQDDSVGSDDADLNVDPLTLRALRDLARLWDRPWPAFMDECRERAARHGITVEELAAVLLARLHWQRDSDG